MSYLHVAPKMHPAILHVSGQVCLRGWVPSKIIFSKSALNVSLLFY